MNRFDVRVAPDAPPRPCEVRRGRLCTLASPPTIVIVGLEWRNNQEGVKFSQWTGCHHWAK